MNQSQCLFRWLVRLLVGLAVVTVLATAQDAAGGTQPVLPEWLDLDLREFNFWLRMAHVQQLSDQLRAMGAARIAQACPD